MLGQQALLSGPSLQTRLHNTTLPQAKIKHLSMHVVCYSFMQYMVIIIPGWRHAATEWSAVSDQLTRLAVPHTVLDIPGFGTVPHDPAIQTLSDLAAWCNAQIAEIATTAQTPLSLAGHSCGGRIALQLVADGMQVDDLVLCGSPNLYRPSRSTALKKLLVQALNPVKSFIPEKVRRILRSDDYQAVQNDKLLNLYLDVVRDDQTHLLNKVVLPTALLWGEQDEAAPVWIAHELHEKLKDSTLDIISGVGHNIHHEKPQLLAAKIAHYVA